MMHRDTPAVACVFIGGAEMIPEVATIAGISSTEDVGAWLH